MGVLSKSAEEPIGRTPASLAKALSTSLCAASATGNRGEGPCPNPLGEEHPAKRAVNAAPKQPRVIKEINRCELLIFVF